MEPKFSVCRIYLLTHESFRPTRHTLTPCPRSHFISRIFLPMMNTQIARTSMHHLKLVIVAGLFAFAPWARAQTITFDDLSGTPGTSIPNGYMGLNWSNFSTINPSSDSSLHNTGCEFGTISGPNVACSRRGYTAAITAPIGTTFDVVSGYFTSAWNNTITLRIETSLADSTVNSTDTYTLTNTSPTFLNLNLTGISRIAFATEDNYSLPFVIDNLTVRVGAIPEPSTYCLFLGIAALVLAAWHRFRR